MPAEYRDGRVRVSVECEPTSWDEETGAVDWENPVIKVDWVKKVQSRWVPYYGTEIVYPILKFERYDMESDTFNALATYRPRWREGNGKRIHPLLDIDIWLVELEFKQMIQDQFPSKIQIDPIE